MRPPLDRGVTGEVVDVVRVRDVRTRSGRWWGRHERALRGTALLAIAWTAAYLVWRIGWSWSGAQPVLWIGLLLCELFGFVSLALLTWFSWSERTPTRPVPTADHTVDVYVCTYDEPDDVLRATLLGCRALAHPHTTWLLDDGRRPEMAALAARLGARYLARPTNEHAKAGNINHALGKTSGELVFVLDADHVPMPDALDALVGYFDDPGLAVVQTPHDFLNHDSFQHYSPGRHEQSVFFEVVCPGKDRHGAPFWCGSAAMIRRQALLEVGGVATGTIAEDFHTTIAMQRRGWTTRYHHETVVQGLAPHDLASYLLQRDRWARGNLTVLRTPESPLRARELTRRQRLSYGASLFAYLAGPVRALLLAVLGATLWTGRLPLKADWAVLASLWLPATVLCLVAGGALGRGYMQVKEATHFELLTAWIHLRALRCVVDPRRATFRVTPKEGIDEGGWSGVRQLPLVLALAVLLGCGVAFRVGAGLGLLTAPRLPGLAAWVVPVLGVVELRRVLRTLWWVAIHQQRRLVRRFPADQRVDLWRQDRCVDHAVLTDVSTTGAGLVSAIRPATGELLRLRTLLPAATGGWEPVEAMARVVAVSARGDGRWKVGLQIVAIDDDAADAVAEYGYVVELFRELRAVQPAAPHAPVLVAAPAAA